MAGINSVDGHPALSTSTLMADNFTEMFLLSAFLLSDLDMQLSNKSNFVDVPLPTAMNGPAELLRRHLRHYFIRPIHIKVHKSGHFFSDDHSLNHRHPKFR